MLVLRQEPERRAKAHRRADRLHLRRVRRALQRHHRRGVGGRAQPRDPEPPQALRDQGDPRSVRREPGAGQEGPGRRGPQPLQAHRGGLERRGRGAPEVQHPADRADRVRQDASRPDPGQDPARAVHDRRRDQPHRSGLRRRGRREHHPAPAPGRGLRRGARGARHRLHRRDRQDRAEVREPVDHPGRVGRRRAAGAPQDPRGHGRERAAPGRPEAPPPGVHPGRHDEHPVRLRRRVRRPRQDHREPHREVRHRLRRRDQGEVGPPAGRRARPGPAGGSPQVRADPGVRGPAAGGGHARTTWTRPP